MSIDTKKECAVFAPKMNEIFEFAAERFLFYRVGSEQNLLRTLVVHVNSDTQRHSVEKNSAWTHNNEEKNSDAQVSIPLPPGTVQRNIKQIGNSRLQSLGPVGLKRLKEQLFEQVMYIAPWFLRKDKWTLNELISHCVQEENRLKQEKTKSVHLASTSKDMSKKRNKGKEATSAPSFKKQQK